MKWDIFMLLRYILGDSGGVGRVDGIFAWCFNRGAKSFYPCKRRRRDRLPLGLLGLLG